MELLLATTSKTMTKGYAGLTLITITQLRSLFMFFVIQQIILSKVDTLRTSEKAIIFRINPSKVFLGKGLLKTCSNVQENTHTHSPVNLLRIFRTPFLKSTFGGLLLYLTVIYFRCVT